MFKERFSRNWALRFSSLQPGTIRLRRCRPLLLSSVRSSPQLYESTPRSPVFKMQQTLLNTSLVWYNFKTYCLRIFFLHGSTYTVKNLIIISWPAAYREPCNGYFVSRREASMLREPILNAKGYAFVCIDRFIIHKCNISFSNGQITTVIFTIKFPKQWHKKDDSNCFVCLYMIYFLSDYDEAKWNDNRLAVYVCSTVASSLNFWINEVSIDS